MTQEKEKIYKVYKHTLPMSISGKENDMVYIGITRQDMLEKRWLGGRGYIKQECFYNAIKKYTWENFKHEILFCDLTKEEAEQKEIELISYYKSDVRECGYNISHGGNCIGTMSDDTKQKISIANKGNKYGIGHKVSDGAKRKMSEAKKGNQHGKGKKDARTC